MKKNTIVAAIGLFTSAISFAQEVIPMITRWETSGPQDKEIAINTKGGGYYTYKKVGDESQTGQGVLNDAQKTQITLPSSGEYLVEIRPLSAEAPSVLYMGQTRFSESAELKEISQWGNFKRGTSGSLMLAHCKNVVITATDNPDFSEMEDMSNMFYNCQSIVHIPNIEQWNVANVREMQNMFYGVYQFNDDLSSWDTSSVINVSRMFAQTEELPGEFNQDIGNWDLSHVTKIYGMLRYCQAFNQDLSNWDTSSVQDFENLFKGASSFNQNIGSFNLGSATLLSGMLDGTALSCSKYNQTLDQWSQNAATPLDLVFSAEGLTYSDQASRNFLVNSKGWTITGDQYDATCELSTQEYISKADIRLQNPVTNQLHLVSNKEIIEMKVYSVQGQLVKVFQANERQLSDLYPGVYWLQIQFQDQSIQTVKLLKK